MAITVKKITLWRKEVANRAGALADILAPLAGAGADLGVVMGYRVPGHANEAVIEIAAVAGKKASAAAAAAGLSPSPIPSLLAAGDNKPGLGHAMSRAMAGAGISMSFLVAQVVGRKFSAILGFESEADCDRAAPLIKKTTVAKKR